MKEVTLICGAAGFIGSYTTSAFKEAGWSVVGAGRGDPFGLEQYPKNSPFLKGNFESPVFTTQLLEETQPSKIVFIAGPSDVQRSMIDPVRDLKDQLLPLAQILWSASKLERTPGVLLVSSAAVYGNSAKSPVTELEPSNPISPYGFHKLNQEALLDEFSKLYHVPTCKARVFSTYGRGLHRLAIWEIAQRALNGDYSLRGTGQETRDYLHVKDLARALVCIASNAPFEGEVVNVASGKESAIEEVASLIFRNLGTTHAPEFDGQCLPGSPINWCADITSLRKLGFDPQIGLEDGIENTVAWLKSNA